jgi:hydrogenase maturation protease
MTKPKILIACIGNIFLGDDAFGCHVAELLQKRTLQPEVVVSDFGIRGLDLAYALVDGYETTIFVDAAPRGGEAGTVYVIEPDQAETAESVIPGVEPHNMDPLKVLAMVRSMGGDAGKIYVVGCEPQFTNADGDGHMGLSAPVVAALPKAVAVVESLIERILANEFKTIRQAA